MLYKYIGNDFKVNDITIVANGDIISVKEEKLDLEGNVQGPSCKYNLVSLTNDTTKKRIPLNIFPKIYTQFEPLNTDIEDELEIKNFDKVQHPAHYTQGSIECIDAMIAAYGNEAVKHFCQCNAFKYLWRFEHKNKIEDLDKSLWYINKYKELV